MTVGVVGGSDLVKITEQLGSTGDEHRRSSLDLLRVRCSVTMRGDELCNVGSNWFALLLLFVFAVITDYDYVFSENGLVAHKNGQLIGTQVSLWAPYIVAYTVFTYMHWSTSPDISF